MAITRRVTQITMTFEGTEDPRVSHTAMISDDVEGTSSPDTKRWNAPAVVNAAIALRDAIVAQSAGQGRPLTF